MNGRPIIVPHWHHFGMGTTRLQEMMEWYGNVFGFQLVAEAMKNPDAAPMMNFLTNDLAHHRGVFTAAPNLQDETLEEKRGHIRIQHMAWEYSTIDDLLETWA